MAHASAGLHAIAVMSRPAALHHNESQALNRNLPTLNPNPQTLKPNPACDVPQYYTIHKILAGLLDQFVLAGNAHALAMAEAACAYFLGRIDAVIEASGSEAWARILDVEFGGGKAPPPLPLGGSPGVDQHVQVPCTRARMAGPAPLAGQPSCRRVGGAGMHLEGGRSWLQA
jgi:hypothetical protein